MKSTKTNFKHAKNLHYILCLFVNDIFFCIFKWFGFASLFNLIDAVDKELGENDNMFGVQSSVGDPVFLSWKTTKLYFVMFKFIGFCYFIPYFSVEKKI